MKKLILLVAFVSILFSCSNGGNASSSNNNSSSGNVDYYFKIKINGVEHKVQGNTSGFAGYNPNLCQASVSSTTGLGFWIDDITYPNYVSGQNLRLSVSIPNCHVGQNQATVIFLSSPVFDAFTPSASSAFVENSGLYCAQPTNNCSYPLISNYSSKITINITDMGTTGAQGYGNTFKGNYNGTIYFGTYSNGVHNMNIPMQFSMEFEAYRTN